MTVPIIYFQAFLLFFCTGQCISWLNPCLGLEKVLLLLVTSVSRRRPWSRLRLVEEGKSRQCDDWLLLKCQIQKTFFWGGLKKTNTADVLFRVTRRKHCWVRSHSGERTHANDPLWPGKNCAVSFQLLNVSRSLVQPSSTVRGPPKLSVRFDQCVGSATRWLIYDLMLPNKL